MSLTKNRILDAVTKHIKNSDNIDDLSIKKIADEVGIGKSTVYEHFKSKGEIIDEAYIALLDNYQNILATNYINTDFTSSLKNVISRVIEVMNDAKMVMELILKNSSSPLLSSVIYEKIEELQSSFESMIYNLLEVGIKENIISSHALSNKSKYILKALLSSLPILFIQEKTDMNKVEMVDFIFETIIYNLR